MFSFFGGRPAGSGAQGGGEPQGGAPLPPPPSNVLQEGGFSGLAEKKGQSLVNFDPTGLERAAKAAKELDSSRSVKHAAEIVLSQERTQQLEREAKIREYEVELKNAELRRVQVEHEERRKTMELETSHINHRNKQQDELARRRDQERIEAQRRLQEEQLRKQEESIQKQEAMKRGTIEYEKELQRKNDMAKIGAESEAKIKYERSNRDLHLENMKLQAAEYRDTTLKAIELAGQTFWNGTKEFLDDREKVTTTVAAFSLLALGIYSARTAASVTGKYIEATMGKPSLVRETSRRTFRTMLKEPVKTVRRLFKGKEERDLLGDVVLSPSLAEQMRGIAWTTINAQRNRAPFRNLLLYGPPGTGKTMFSKNLAYHSGMDYAIMTGADVAPLGKDSVNELHKLFDWAEKSRRGLVLFIDESDAFLRKRGTEKISEEMRNALNAFLYRTGESSKKFMVIMATNQPEQLDWAVNDRVDESVEFILPGKEERHKMLQFYFNKYITNHHIEDNAKQIYVAGVGEEHLKKMAETTEGFSGREISKLIIAMQAAAFGSLDNTLSVESTLKVLQSHIEQHRKKEIFKAVAPPS